jgi:hypothetical protein
VALVLTALGGLGNLRETLFGYLFAFVFWLGLCVGAILLLGTFHASGARWAVVLRRALELVGATIPLFALLFLPIALGMGELFVWVHPEAGLGDHTLALLDHKKPYLNIPFFLGRAIVYFAAWSVVALLMLRWSRKLDETGALRMLAWQRRLACISLPVVGLTMSFAATDWMMSLEPTWQSSIYGVYVLAGAYAAALALLGLLAAVFRKNGAFGAILTRAHYQRIGTLLLAMICFWAYIAFSQFMLIWIAAVPEESTWYVARLSGGWGILALIVAAGHFLVPFFALISRKVKQRPRSLAAVCGWLLVIHAVDTYWLILPALHPGGPSFHWTSLTALVGIGALVGASALWRARGDYTVPVRDPFLLNSLETPLP